MALSIGRYLDIRRKERPRLAWLYAMLFVSVTGCVWGEAIIEAGFLREVGVQYLPLAIACSAVLSMASISIYNVFADRIANHRLLLWVLALSLLGIGAGVTLLTQGWIKIAFPLLYVVDSVLVRDLLNMHWPIYVNGFFDTQSAKRIFPVLSSASRLAAVVGGLTMPLVNRALSTTGVIAVMLLAQFAMMALSVLMQRAARERVAGVPGAPDGYDQTRFARPNRADGHAGVRQSGGWANIREGYRYVTGSRYLRWIAAATLLTMVLLAYFNYETGRLLLAELKTVQAISNFTALLRGLGNLVALPFQLFLLSRLIGRIGVGKAGLIYPSTSLLAVTGLSLAPGLVTAGFGYLTRTVLRNTFYIPVDSLLYNAVPVRIKARARGFVSGYVMTTGSLIGGLALMFNAQLAGPFLAVVFTALALAYLGSALEVKRYYGKAVVAMLEQEDYLSLQTPSDTELSVVDDVTLAGLAAKMAQPNASPELKVFTAQVICQVGGARAIPILDLAIREDNYPGVRARLLEVLATCGSNTAAAEAIYMSYLFDPDKDVRKAALTGLEESTGDDLVRFQALVAPFLTDEEPEVRAAALVALVRSGCFYTQPAANRVLETLLSSEKPESRALGVSLLGRLAGSPGRPDGRDSAGHQSVGEHTSHLLAALGDPSDQVRLAAVLALEEAAGPSERQLPAWLSPGQLGHLLSDRVERVREVTVGLLARSSLPQAQALLAGALDDPSPRVRSAAVETLVQAGRVVVGTLRPLLNLDRSGSGVMAAAVLGRIDPAQFGPEILSGPVTCYLQATYRCWAYLTALAEVATTPALSLLRCALLEQNARRIDDIFYLLRAIGPAPTVDKAAVAVRSPDPLTRANAVEVLEVLTTPQIARLLGPLCEEPPVPRHILAAGSSTWGQPAPGVQDTIDELIAGSENPWLSQLAAAAGASMAPEGVWRVSPALATPAPAPGIYRQEENMLSAIEKVIFLKEVPFFQGMTVDQLRVLANVCEEEFFPAEARLFSEGDPGGTLYVVVSGRVTVEQEKRKGSVARLATVEAHSYLGETDFFDNNCRSNSASAIQDTLTLKLRREPLMALARQYPDLSLELINVLSERLREANNRVAELTRAHPQKLHKLYDQLG